MNYYLVAPAKTFHNSDNLLTYESEEKLEVGQIVSIPLGKKEAIGIVTQKVNQPEFATKPILNIIHPQPLPKHLMKALFWLADYYRCPLSSVVQTILPRGITKKRRSKPLMSNKLDKIPDNPLNTAQKRAIKAIEENPANTILLHGITNPSLFSSQKSHSPLSSCAISSSISKMLFCCIPNSPSRSAIRFGSKPSKTLDRKLSSVHAPRSLPPSAILVSSSSTKLTSLPINRSKIRSIPHCASPQISAKPSSVQPLL